MAAQHGTDDVRLPRASERMELSSPTARDSVRC
jgi:hypothetical protein